MLFICWQTQLYNLYGVCFSTYNFLCIKTPLNYYCSLTVKVHMSNILSYISWTKWDRRTQHCYILQSNWQPNKNNLYSLSYMLLVSLFYIAVFHGLIICECTWPIFNSLMPDWQKSYPMYTGRHAYLNSCVQKCNCIQHRFPLWKVANIQLVLGNTCKSSLQACLHPLRWFIGKFDGGLAIE